MRNTCSGKPPPPQDLIDDPHAELQRIRSIFAEDTPQLEPAAVLEGQEITEFRHAQLTGTLAHELRTPLNSMRATAFMMQRKATAAGLDLTTPFERLERNINQCNDVIVALLEKSWSNQLQLLELAFDEWLSKLVRDFAARAPGTIEIDCDFAFGDGLARFDPVRLEISFINILSNAVNALSAPGGLMPAKAIAEPRIAIRTGLTARGLEVSLSNNGPSMPQDQLDRIRRPWVTAEFFGSGLGLSYVKCIFERHMGGMEVENLDPQGVKFTTWIEHQATA